MVHNLVIFYGEELSAPRLSPKMEDRPFVAADALCLGDRDPLTDRVPLSNKLLNFFYINSSNIHYIGQTGSLLGIMLIVVMIADIPVRFWVSVIRIVLFNLKLPLIC
jgi:hypothetical protein